MTPSERASLSACIRALADARHAEAEAWATLAAVVRDSTGGDGDGGEHGAVSVAEFARRIGVGHTTAASLVRSACVRTVRVGRRRLVPTSEVARVLREGAGPASEAPSNVVGHPSSRTGRVVAAAARAAGRAR